MSDYKQKLKIWADEANLELSVNHTFDGEMARVVDDAKKHAARMIVLLKLIQTLETELDSQHKYCTTNELKRSGESEDFVSGMLNGAGVAIEQFNDAIEETLKEIP